MGQRREVGDGPWRVTLPGPPPSVNHSYKIVKVPRRGGGGLVSRLAKADGIEAYQAGVTLIVRAARPSGWKPAAPLRLRYWFYLKRKVDCDNAMKALNDAVARALGVDDDSFLPCVVAKELGHKDPYVVVEIGA